LIKLKIYNIWSKGVPVKFHELPFYLLP